MTSQPKRPLQILLLWDRASRVASTVQQHVAALQSYSFHQVHPLAVLGELPRGLELQRFDGVVIHYSLVACSDDYVSPTTRRAIAEFSGVKAMFIQDEYRHVHRTIDAMQTMGINALFTCVPTNEIEKVYPAEKLLGVIRRNVLTGYVDKSLLELELPDPGRRPIDIGYRARKLPAWLGELGQEKWNIGRRVAEDAPGFGLKVDLAHREEERLYGQSWINFMARCKATLGVESGASVFDFSGDVQKAVECDIEQNPDLSFEQLQLRHFSHLEGRVRLNQISPRCFEAAALRTLMVLYEGDYSGRLQPWSHYVPLRKDHSNFEQVVAVLRDAGQIKEITDRAYEEVACAEINSFKALAREFDQVLEEAWTCHRPASLPPYTSAQVKKIASRRGLAARSLLLRRWLFNTAYFFLFRGLLRWVAEDRRDRIHRRLHAKLRAIRAMRRSPASREPAALSRERR